MPFPRKFDHDEARRLYAVGVSRSELAARYGVTYRAVYHVTAPPQVKERTRISHRDAQRRRLRAPCVRGCGRTAWHRYGRSGVCQACASDERRSATHGTEAMYTSRGCRCDDCRRAMNAKRRERRHNGSVLTHNASGYRNGCRCDVCRAAYTVASREYRRHRREKRKAAA